MDENPGRQFGEISRIVADRWRQMSDADKQVGFIIFPMIHSCPSTTFYCLQTYAERAKKLNEEKEREEREGKRQEGDRIRLTEDRRQTTTAAPPKAASPGPPAPASPMGRARQESGGATGSVQPTQIRQEPLFHSVPPRPQRLLHSEAYIKYIEGLNKDSRSMCNWDRQLNVTQEVNINHSGSGKGKKIYYPDPFPQEKVQEIILIPYCYKIQCFGNEKKFDLTLTGCLLIRWCEVKTRASCPCPGWPVTQANTPPVRTHSGL